MFGSSILKSNFFYHQALKCDNILKEILVSLLYFFTLSQVNENFMVTYFMFLTLTPHDLNSITFVVGSKVDPGGAPPGPLNSGFLLPPET